MNKPGTIDANSQGNMKYGFDSLSKQISTPHPVLVEENIVNHTSTTLVSTREKVILNPSSNNCRGNTVSGTESVKSGQLVETPRYISEKKQKLCKPPSKTANTVHKRIEKSEQLLVKKCHLSRHIFTHKIGLPPKRPFSCEDCGKHFSQKQNMKRHILVVHMNQKHFICGHCQKAFGFKGNLTQHVNLVHLKDPKYMRRFMCLECDKGFSFKQYLTRHLFTHKTSLQKRKPFECNNCELRYTQRSHLNRHQRRIHNKVKS